MKNNLKSAATLLMVLILNPLTGYSKDIEKDPAYYLIMDETISFTEADSGKTVTPDKMPELAGLAGMNRNPLAAGALINAGSTMWGVINGGAPTGDYTSAYASAIPGFSFNWGNITGWKGPKEIIYNYKVTNRMGVDVIDVKYKISFFYGGTEDTTKAMNATTFTNIAAGGGNKPTKGVYITNFTVQPVALNLKWGWKFNLTVKMSDPMNIGTRISPVAYLQSDLNWIVSTPASIKGGTWTYGVDGLGNFKDLTRGITGNNTNLPVPQPVKSVPAVNWN